MTAAETLAAIRRDFVRRTLAGSTLTTTPSDAQLDGAPISKSDELVLFLLAVLIADGEKRAKQIAGLATEAGVFVDGEGKVTKRT